MYPIPNWRAGDFMETILIEVADLLRGYVATIDQAVAEDDFLTQLQLVGILVLPLIMLYSSVKAFWQRISRHDEKLARTSAPGRT